MIIVNELDLRWARLVLG